MTKTITALYDDKTAAQGAVNELVSNGFDKEQISLVSQAEDKEAPAPTTNLKSTDTSDTKAIVQDAGIGAAVGGVGGLIIGLAALAIPGIGPIVAAGPIAAALAGLGVGAATGGLVGAMQDVGLSYEQLEYYAEGVRRGHTLVTVHADEANFDKAQEIINRHNPVDLEKRKTEWLAADVAEMPAVTGPLASSATVVTSDETVDNPTADPFDQQPATNNLGAPTPSR